MEFKISFNNHKQSFKFENKKHVTELSKAVWNAKGAGETPLIEKLNKRLLNKREKQKKNLLNKRSELVPKSRQINKFLLKNVRLKA